MTIQGKQIPYIRQPVAVADIELDPTNPRIQYLLGQKAGVVAKMSWTRRPGEKGPGQSTLSIDFAKWRGIWTLILQRGNNSKFRVREGNCRTVACRHLGDQHPGDTRFMNGARHDFRC